MDSVAAILLISFAALVQGYSGFGFGIVAMALLALMRLPLVGGAMVVTFVGTIVVAGLLWLSRKNGKIDWRSIGLLLLGAMLGLPLGYWFLLRFGDLPIGRVVLGVILVTFSTYGLVRKRGTVRMPISAAGPLGLRSGFVGGAFVSGGPPVVVYLNGRAEDPRVMKPSIQAIFLIMLFMRIAMAGAPGDLWSSTVWIQTAMTVPVALAALWGGTFFPDSARRGFTASRHKS